MEKAVTKAMMNALKKKKEEGEIKARTVLVQKRVRSLLHTMAAEKKEASNSGELLQ